MLAGQIMLENGAETYRVEDTMERICKSNNIHSVDTFATPTGIFLSVKTSEYEYSTGVKRVRRRITDVNKVYEVNNVSRLMAEKKIQPEEAFDMLTKIDSQYSQSGLSSLASAGACSGAFALLLGGSVADGLITALSGALIQYIDNSFAKRNISYFLSNIAGGAVAALFAILFSSILNIGSLDKIIIGSIIPLLPGIAITNAIRDTIYGDLVSGTTRGVEALLIAISIATGVVIVLKTWLNIFGGIIS